MITPTLPILPAANAAVASLRRLAASCRFALLVRHLLVAAIVLILAGCAGSPSQPEQASPGPESTSSSASELLARAGNSSGDEAARLTLEAITELESAGLLRQARELARDLDPQAIEDTRLQLDVVLTQARLALQAEQAEAAITALETVETPDSQQFPQRSQLYYELLSQAVTSSNNTASAIETLVQANEAVTGQQRQELHDAIWMALSRLGSDELDELAGSANSYELRGWIELARVYRADQFSIPSQLASVAQWRRIWNQHSAASAMPRAILNLELAWEQRPRRIALILPLSQPAGIAIQEGFLSAYYRSLELTREVPELLVYDSSGATSVFPLYDEAVDAGADLVIGPLNKTLVNQLHQQSRLPVPTLALNYSDYGEPGPNNLYQYGLAPEDEIAQTIDLAWQNGFRNAAILTPSTDDYLRLQNTFADSWIARGGNLVARTSFSANADYAAVIKRLLAIDSSEARADQLLSLLPRSNMRFTPRRRADIDFIFLIANPRQGRQIKPTLAFYFAENLPVYALPSINDGLDNPTENQDLDGIIFTDAPWVLTSGQALKSQVDDSLRPAQGPLQRLRAMGVDAFMLYARLGQLRNEEITSLQGATGQLSMATNRQIRRRLPVARFENGAAQVLDVTSPAGDD